MTGPRKKICALVLAASVSVGLAGCSRPDANAPVRITGDKDAAIPATDPTTTSSTTEAPPTTLFYSPDGPGSKIAAETTTTTEAEGFCCSRKKPFCCTRATCSM